jgi:hypothetical protein
MSMETFSMRHFFLICMLICGFGSRPVVANVVYDWVGFGASPCCSGQIVISDAAYASNQAAFSTPRFIYPAEAYTGTDIASFRFDAAAFGPAFITGYYDVDLAVAGDGLAGGIDAFGLESSIQLAGNTELWTIMFYRTDIPGRCHFPQDDCTGETGRWVLRTNGTVPEPTGSVLLVVGLGILAAGRVRKIIGPVAT